MENLEVKPKLSKHVTSACNSIQKEVERKKKHVTKLREKILYTEHELGVTLDEISGLEESIAKLQGE